MAAALLLARSNQGRLSALAAVAVLLATLGACQSQPTPPKTEAAASDHAGSQVAAAGGTGSAPGSKTAAAMARPPRPGLAVAAAPLPNALTITFAAPQGDDLVLAQGAIGFDRPVVAIGAVDTPASSPCATVTPAAPLRWVWLGTTTLGFLSEAALPAATEFTVEVGTGCKALDGSQLSAPYRYTFKTAAPRLVQTWPQANGSFVLATDKLHLAFDQPIDPASLTDSLLVQSAGKTLAWQLVDGGQRPESLRQDPWAKAVPAQFAAISVQGATPGSEIQLSLRPGLRSLLGPVAGKAQEIGKLKILGPLKLVTVGCDKPPCDPEQWDALRLEFSQPLADDAGKQLTKSLSFEPPLPPWRLHCYGSTCNVSAHVADDAPSPSYLAKPRSTYTVRIKSGGIRDAWGQSLPAAAQAKLQTGPLSPQLRQGTWGKVLEAATAGHKMALYLRNLQQVTVRHRALTAADLSRAGAFDRGDAVDLALDHTTVLDPNRQLDWDERRVVDLMTLTGGKRGLVAVEISSPQWLGEDGKPRTIRQVLQLTDLHLLARLGGNESLFWVTSLQTGKPQAGVALELQAGGGQVLWSGVTDAAGIAHGPGGLVVQEEGEGPRQVPVLLARTDSDMAALWLDRDQRAAADHPEAPWYGDIDTARSFLFSDKGIYRVGDTIQLKGLTRLLTGDGLSLPKEGEPVLVRLLDPVGDEVGRATASTSVHGTFHVQLVPPAFGRRGSYQIEAQVLGHKAQIGVEVREYRAPRFLTRLRLPQRHIVTGEPLPLEVDASYWSGGALANAPLHVSAEGTAWSQFEPTGWPLFGFADDVPLGPGAEARFAHQQDTVLDKDGHLGLSIATPLAPLTKSVPVDLDVTATDPGGRSTSARGSVWIHPAAALAGVHLPMFSVRVGESLAAEAIAVAPEGEVVAGVALKAEWSQITYQQIRRVGVGGVLEWQTERVVTPVHSCDLTSAAKPQVCAFTPKTAGNYAVLITATDSKGRLSRASQSAVVVGPDRVVWRQDEERPPLLQVDREQYRPGDVAKIAVRNPAPGSVALLAVERAGMLQTQLVELATDATEITVPLTAAHVPNCFVSLTVFSGRRSPAVIGATDTGAPRLDMGVVRLNVSAEDHQLAVTVLPARTTAQPGDKVAVSVQLRDAKGNPRAGEVTLLAVDEAVLSLTAQATPDPFAAMTAAVPAELRTYALIDALLRGKVGENKGEDGGGGGGAAVRSDMRDVAFYAPALQAGPDGIATATIALPGNLTTFRIMAVAVSGAQHFGAGDARLQVSKPLMLYGNWPKRVGLGDRFEATALIRNVGDKALQVAVQLTPGKGLEGTSRQTIDLPAKSSKELRFALTASSAGKVEVKLEAKAGTVSDALADVVEVVDLAPVQTAAVYGVATQDVQQALQRAAKSRSDIGGLSVSAQPVGRASLRDGASWLAAYPYSCTEQLASRLLAQLYLTSGPPSARAEDGAIAALIAQLVDREMWPAGALRLWPNGGDPDRRATAWTLRVLHLAKTRGYAVPERLLRDMAAWLTTELATLTPASPRDQAERARILAALAVAGQPAHGEALALFAVRAGTSTALRADLLEALSAGGPEAAVAAATLRQELMGELVVDAATAFLPDTTSSADAGLWPSDVRATAQLLTGLLAVPAVAQAGSAQRPLVDKLARWLVAARDRDHYATTQDGAWALQAWSRYLETLPAATGTVALDVQLGKKSLGTLELDAASGDPQSLQLAQREVPAALTPLVLAKRGAAAVHYSIRYDYALPLADQPATNAGYFVRKTLYDTDGKQLTGPLRRGQFVVVVVSVLVDRQRFDVAIRDPLPAGLEAEDLTLATSSAALSRRLEAVRQGLWQDGGAASPLQVVTPYPSHQEQAPGEVRWFFDALPPGLHTLTYLARATAAGQFSAPGTQVNSLYQPEVSGRTAPWLLTVE